MRNCTGRRGGSELYSELTYILVIPGSRTGRGGGCRKGTSLRAENAEARQNWYGWTYETSIPRRSGSVTLPARTLQPIGEGEVRYGGLQDRLHPQVHDPLPVLPRPHRAGGNGADCRPLRRDMVPAGSRERHR